MKKKPLIIVLSVLVVALLIFIGVYYIFLSPQNSKLSKTKSDTTMSEKIKEITEVTHTKVVGKTKSTTTQDETQVSENNCETAGGGPIGEEHGLEYKKAWESEDGVIRFMMDSNYGPKGLGRYKGTYKYKNENTEVFVWIDSRIMLYGDGNNCSGAFDGYILTDKEVLSVSGEPLGVHTYLNGFYKIDEENKKFTVTVCDMESEGDTKYDSYESKYKNGDKVVFHQISE